MTDDDLIAAAEPGLPSLASLADMAEHITEVGGKPVLSCGVEDNEIEIRVTASDIPQIMATTNPGIRLDITLTNRIGVPQVA